MEKSHNYLVTIIRSQLSVYNGCHDVLMMSFGINSIAVSNNHGVDYLCIIFGFKKVNP